MLKKTEAALALLSGLVVRQEVLEGRIDEAVQFLRTQGVSWDAIAQATGLASKQAAHWRWGRADIPGP